MGGGSHEFGSNKSSDPFQSSAISQGYILLIHACSVHAFFVYFLSRTGQVAPAERPLSPAYDELPPSSSLG